MNVWRFVAILSLALTLSTSARADDRRELDPEALLHEIRALRAQLDVLEHDALSGDRKQVRKGFRELDGRLETLEKQAKRARRADRFTPAPMNPHSFEGLRHALKAQRYGEGRLAFLTNAAAGNWFVAEQVRLLLLDLPYASERVRALELLWPKVLDPHEAHLVYAAFPYGSDRPRVRAILARHA